MTLDKPDRPAAAAGARSAVDERMPFWHTVLLGLQHTLVMYAGAVVVPIVVGTALGLDADRIADLVSIDLVLAGVGTLLQAGGLWRFGIRMPLVVGAASSGIVPMIAVGQSRGLPTVYGSLLVAGAVWVLVAPYFSLLLRLFPEVVTGTVITLIGLTLIPVGIRLVAGSDPGAGDYGGLGRLALAAATMALMVVFRRMLRGLLGQLSILLALVAGAVAGWASGIGSLAHVGDGPVVGLMGPMHFGAPRFDLPSVLLFLVIVFVLMVEGSGQGLAVGRVVGTPVGPGDIARLLRVDGLMTLCSGFCNGFVYTTFGQNIGLIALTRVRSRYPVVVVGVLLIGCGVLQPVGRVAAAIPSPVIGAAAIMTFGALTVSGIQILARVDFESSANLTIVMLSLGVGLVPAFAPHVYRQLPDFAEMFLDSGVATGTLLAIGLNAVFHPRPAPLAEPEPSTG
ncbi:nucleobase:cation symporter-2 family protein [Nocardia heshunensis]